jgi:hypothetical protein
VHILYIYSNIEQTARLVPGLAVAVVFGATFRAATSAQVLSWYLHSSFLQILYWIKEIAIHSRVFILDLPTNINL